MTPVLRSLGVLALTALLGLASCSSVQSTEACPGKDCPAELGAVADSVTATDDVLELVRVTHSSHLEKGTSGGVSVVAVARTADDAASLAQRLAGVYLAGDLDPVDRILVDVRPSPGTTTPDDQSGWQGGTAGDASQVACAPTECAAQLQELRAALADEFGADLTIDAATWVPDRSPPVIQIECTIAAAAVDQAEVNEIARRLATVAADAGALEWGDFRWTLSFLRSTVFSFTFDGETGRMLS